MLPPDHILTQAVEVATALGENGARIIPWKGSCIEITFDDPLVPKQAAANVQPLPQNTNEKTERSRQGTSATDASNSLIEYEVYQGETTIQAPPPSTTPRHRVEPSFGTILAEISLHLSVLSRDQSYVRLPPSANLHTFPLVGCGLSFMARLVPRQFWSFELPLHHENVVIKSLRHFDVVVREEAQGDRRVPRLQAFQRELRVLTHEPLRNHDNIVKLLGVGWERNRSDIASPVFHWPLLIQEYASYGSLMDFLETTDVDFDERLRLCIDVGNGLAALHACDIVHTDVKPENVLIFPGKQQRFVAKISDFALSLFNLDGKSPPTRELGRTEPWNAPESGELLSWPNRKLTDVYSYGFLLWRVMAYGHAPFDQNKGSISKRGESMIKSAKQQDEVPLRMRQSLAACIQDIDIMGKLYAAAGVTVQRDRSKRQLAKAIDVLTRSPYTELHNSQRTIQRQSITSSTPLRDTTIPYEQGLGIWSYGGNEKRLDEQCLLALESHFLYAQNCGENISAATELVLINASAELSASFLGRHFAGDVMEAGRVSSTRSLGFAWLCVSAGTRATGSADAINILSRALKCERLVPKDTLLPACAGYALYLGSEFILQDVLANTVAGKSRFLDSFRTLLCQGAGMRLPIPKDIFDGSGRRYHERIGKPYWLTGDPATRPPDGVVDKDYVLRIAAGWGSLEDVQLLVRKFRANVNATDYNGETALLKACRAGHVRVVEWLVNEAGALASIASRNGVTPLHWLNAFPTNKAHDVTALLCSAGAKVNAIMPDTMANPDGAESRYWFFRGPPMMRVVATGNVEAVKALLRHGADPLTRRTGDFEMPLSSLVFAVRRARVDVLEVMVDKIGTDVLWERRTSKTRLIGHLLSGSQTYLAKIHGEAFEEALIDTFNFIWSRADAVHRQLLSTNSLGETAIQVAAKNGNFILAKLILESCPSRPTHLKRLVATLGLQTAISAGHLAMTQYMLDAGGDPLHYELSVVPDSNSQFSWYPIDTAWNPVSLRKAGHNSIHLCAFAGYNAARMTQQILHRFLLPSRLDETLEQLGEHDNVTCYCVRPTSDDVIVDTRNDNDETPFFLALRQHEYAMAHALQNAGANINVIVRGLPLVEHALKWNNAHRVIRYLIGTCRGCVRMTRADDGTELRTAMITQTAGWPIEEASELIQFVQEHAYAGWTWDKQIEDAIVDANEAIVDLLLGARGTLLLGHATPLHLYGSVQAALVIGMQSHTFDVSSTPQKQAKALLDRRATTHKVTQIIRRIRESYPEATLGSSAGMDILRTAKQHCQDEVRWRARRYGKGLVSRTKLETELNQQLFPWLVSLYHQSEGPTSSRVLFAQDVERVLRETVTGEDVKVVLDATTCLVRVEAAPEPVKSTSPSTSTAKSEAKASGRQDFKNAFKGKRLSLLGSAVPLLSRSRGRD